MRPDSGEIHSPAERVFNQAVLPVSVMSDSSSAIKVSHVAQRRTCVLSIKTHCLGQTQHSVSSSPCSSNALSVTRLPHYSSVFEGFEKCLKSFEVWRFIR